MTAKKKAAAAPMTEEQLAEIRAAAKLEAARKEVALCEQRITENESSYTESRTGLHDCYDNLVAAVDGYTASDKLRDLQDACERMGRCINYHLESYARLVYWMRRAGRSELDVDALPLPDVQEEATLLYMSRAYYAQKLDPKPETWYRPYDRQTVTLAWVKRNYAGELMPETEWTFNAVTYTIQENGTFQTGSWSRGTMLDLAGFTKLS